MITPTTSRCIAAAATAILFTVSTEADAFTYSNGFANASGSDAAFDTVDWDYIYNDSGNSMQGDASDDDPLKAVISSANGSTGAPGYIFLSSGSGWRFFQEEVLVYSTDLSPFAYTSLDSFSFALNNTSANDGLAAALKIDGTWYVSDTLYAATGWTGFSIDPNVDTTWSTLTVNVGVSPLGTSGTASLPSTGTLEAVGMYVAETIPVTNRIRIDTISVEATFSASEPEIVGVTASSDDGNGPENTLDENFGTRWSAEGSGEWIEYELNDVFPVIGMRIAFYNGDQRVAFFDIEVSTNGTNWTQVFSGESSGTTTGFEDFTFLATNGQYVRYVGDGNSVNAWNSLTEVELMVLSEPDTEAPSAPQNLSATAISQNDIDLEWDASTDNVAVAGYDIYRNSQFVDTTTGTFYPDSGLQPNTTYSYQVFAFDPSENVSNPSNTAQATTFAPDTESPTAPANLAATAVSSSRIDLDWDPSTDNVGVTGYDIYRDSQYIDTTANTSYPDTGLQPDTTYAYHVIAFDAAENESSSSNTAQATTQQSSGPSKPNASNTGYSGSLTSSGSITVTTNGTTIQNLDVSGSIRVQANNVTIRNCRITGGTYGIQCTYGNTGLLIEDCEIRSSSSSGLYGGNFTARRLYVHDMDRDAFKPISNFTIEACYITDVGSEPSSHADGVQMVSGSNGVIRWNNFDMPYNDPNYNNSQCLIIQTNNGPVSNIEIDENWINGGGYSVQIRDKGTGYGPPTNVSLTNNQFGRDYQFGILIYDGNPTISGNVWEDTGQPAP